MKKMIALGTAVSMLAATAAVVGAANEDVKSTIGIKLGSKLSADDVKNGEEITFYIVAEKAGGKIAGFNVELTGLNITNAVADSLSFILGGNKDDGYSVVRVDSEVFETGVICMITCEVVDAENAKIAISSSDEEFTTIGTATWSASDITSGDENSSDTSSDTDSSGTSSDTDSSGTSSDTDSSGTSSDTDSSGTSSDTDSSGTSSDTNSSETSGNGNSSNNGSSNEGSTDGDDPNVETGVAFAVIPIALAAAGIVVFRKKK